MKSKLNELLAQISSGDFSPEEVMERYRKLPVPEGETFLHEVLCALRGKMTILDLASFLASKLELASLIQDIVFKISEVMQADRTTLFIADRQRQELWSKVAQGLQTREIRVPIGTGIVGHVYRNAETLVIDDVYQHPLFNSQVDKETGYLTKTMLCLPILSLKGRPIGVVQVINKRGPRFSKEDVQLLQGVTPILALMLENSLLYEKVLQGQRQVSSLLKVANALSAQLELTTLIQTIMSKASELMNADRSSLFLIDRARGELYSRVAEGLGVAEIRFPMTVGLAGEVAMSGETLNIPDAYAHPLFNRETDRKTGYRTRTVLCMPIRDHLGEVMGVTQIINKKDGSFDRSDEELLSAFSAQASIAIQNAQLYERTMNLKGYLECILNSLTNGVVAIDTDGLITVVNPAFLRMMEMKSEDFLGKSVPEAFTTYPALVERVQRGQTFDRAVTDWDFEFANAVDARITANLTALPLMDIAQARIGTLLIFEDVTREKRIRSTFSRYMAKDVVDKLILEDQILGGIKQEVTVLFSDIRGFTSLTEQSTAHDVVEMLNDYFSRMVDVVFKYFGILDKFIGDALMAVFGVPLSRDLPDHAFFACQSALEMKRQLALLNESRVSNGQMPIRIGIGISTGEALCGNIGSEKRMEYTVIGDGVNLASRLEGANKSYSTDIIISEFTYRTVAGRVIVRELDQIRVKGRVQPVRIYELIAMAAEPMSNEKVALMRAFGEGIEAFRARKFEDAAAAFDRALSVDVSDGPSQLYASRCRHCLEHGVSEEWDGVWELTDK